MKFEDIPGAPGDVVVFSGDMLKEQVLPANIWRYLDLPKFVSLLQTRRLYLARGDRFDDPFEGSLTLPDQARRDYLLSLAQKQGIDAERMAQKVIPTLKKKTFIQCWHISDHESIAMWKIYSARGVGIALQTEVGRLVKSIGEAPVKVSMGPVQYCDFQKITVSTYFDDL